MATYTVRGYIPAFEPEDEIHVSSIHEALSDLDNCTFLQGENIYILIKHDGEGEKVLAVEGPINFDKSSLLAELVDEDPSMRKE